MAAEWRRLVLAWICIAWWPGASGFGKAAHDVEIEVSSSTTPSIALSGAYGTGSPRPMRIDGLDSYVSYVGVETNCTVNSVDNSSLVEDFVIVDLNRVQWDEADPCYWQRLTDTAFDLGASVVIASVSDPLSISDVMLPEGPIDGSTYSVPIVFLSQRQHAVLQSYLIVFPLLNITVNCPTCVEHSPEEVPDTLPTWMYTLVLVCFVLVLIMIVAMLVAMIIDATPFAQVHPFPTEEDSPESAMQQYARRCAMQTAIARLSPSVRYGDEAPESTSPDTSALSPTPSVQLEGQTVCAICIEDFADDNLVRNLPCGHVFHTDCMDPWILEHRTCPLCKVEVLSDEMIVNAQSQNDLPSARASDHVTLWRFLDEYDALLESAERLAFVEEDILTSSEDEESAAEQAVQVILPGAVEPSSPNLDVTATHNFNGANGDSTQQDNAHRASDLDTDSTTSSDVGLG